MPTKRCHHHIWHKNHRNKEPSHGDFISAQKVWHIINCLLLIAKQIHCSNFLKAGFRIFFHLDEFEKFYNLNTLLLYSLLYGVGGERNLKLGYLAFFHIVSSKFKHLLLGSQLGWIHASLSTIFHVVLTFFRKITVPAHCRKLLYFQSIILFQCA